MIQSTGGKHGDSWSWVTADGTRMGRERMNLRGQVFELDSSGTAGPDGMPSTIAIRGVTPTGDAGETFGIGEGIFPAAVWKVIGNWYTKKNRGTANAIILSSVAFGPAISSLLLAWFLPILGWRVRL